MRSTYRLKSPDGRTWEFSPDAMDLTNFEEYGTGDIHSDGYQTVAVNPIDGGTSPAFGRGDTTSPDEAEAFLWLDARMETDEDSDGTGDKFSGKYRLVVLNEAGNRVDGGLIHQGRLDRARRGDPDDPTVDYGDWGIPFPRQFLMDGQAEIPVNMGYQVGLQIKTRNGKKKFKLADSAMLSEGYSGTPQN